MYKINVTNIKCNALFKLIYVNAYVRNVRGVKHEMVRQILSPAPLSSFGRAPDYIEFKSLSSSLLFLTSHYFW